jgi:hypothetical protein
VDGNVVGHVTDGAGGAQDDELEVSSRTRTSRRLAIPAFLLAVTSLLLPWWRVTWSSGGVALREDVRAFRPEDPLTNTWAPWVTGIVAAIAIGLLFVRIAGRSDKHEPASWRREEEPTTQK